MKHSTDDPLLIVYRAISILEENSDDITPQTLINFLLEMDYGKIKISVIDSALTHYNAWNLVNDVDVIDWRDTRLRCDTLDAHT